MAKIAAVGYGAFGSFVLRSISTWVPSFKILLPM